MNSPLHATGRLYGRRIITLILFLLLASLANSALAQDATPQPSLPLTDDGTQIVALVNGEPITLPAFERAFLRSTRQSTAASYDSLAALQLDVLIEQTLINQAAAEAGITVTDEEVEEMYRQDRNLQPDDVQWQAWLDENLFTEEEYRASLRNLLITQRMIERVIETEAPIIEEANARHILVATEAEAATILNRVLNGEDFAALAAEFSRDVSSRADGGNLGWFTLDGLLTPEMAQLVFDNAPGAVLGPVETMLGYHVIQVLDFRERAAEPDESAELAATQFTRWLQNLLEDAEIERYVDY